MVAVWLAYLDTPTGQVELEQIGGREQRGVEQIGDQNNRLFLRTVERQATHGAPAFGLLTSQPPPVLLPHAALGILTALRGTRRIGTEGGLGMIAYEKMIIAGRKRRGLGSVPITGENCTERLPQ
jgi:hypothetical protein